MPTSISVKTKTPEWNLRDLLDGRFAMERRGVTVRVFRSEDEAKDWWKTVVAGENLPTITLDKAVRRL